MTTASARALRRWLVALELVLAAESVARQSHVSPNVALILADTASETLLGVICSVGSPPRSDSWRDLMNAASATVRGLRTKWPPELTTNLQASHQSRNGAVHQGVEHMATTAVTAIAAARALLDLLPTVASNIPGIPPGATIVSAVASLVAPAPEVSSRLQAAADALARGESDTAAEEAAIALSQALAQTWPPVDGRGDRFPDARLDKTIGKALEPLQTQVDWLAAWVVPTALGMDPIQYARLRQVLGRVVRTFGGWHVYPEGARTQDDVRWAVERVADSIFRLWVTGVLYPGSEMDWIRKGKRTRDYPK